MTNALRDIQTNATYLRDYCPSKLITVMGWGVTVHHNVVRVYDPLGDLVAEMEECEPVKLIGAESCHIDFFLKHAVDKFKTEEENRRKCQSN